MVRNACKRARRWKCTTPRPAHLPVAPAFLPLKAETPIRPARRKTKSRERKADESVSAIYSAAHRDVLADVCNSAGGSRGLLATSCFRTAASGLSDDPGADVLSGCKPLRDGL